MFAKRLTAHGDPQPALLPHPPPASPSSSGWSMHGAPARSAGSSREAATASGTPTATGQGLRSLLVKCLLQACEWRLEMREMVRARSWLN